MVLNFLSNQIVRQIKNKLTGSTYSFKHQMRQIWLLIYRQLEAFIKVLSVIWIALYYVTRNSDFLIYFACTLVLYLLIQVFDTQIMIFIYNAKRITDHEIIHKLNQLNAKQNLKPTRYFLYEANASYNYLVFVNKRNSFVSSEYLQLPFRHLEIECLKDLGFTKFKIALLRIYDYLFLILGYSLVYFTYRVFARFDLDPIVTYFISFMIFISLSLLYNIKFKQFILQRIISKSYRWMLRQGFSKDELIQKILEAYRFTNHIESSDFKIPNHLKKRIDVINNLEV